MRRWLGAVAGLTAVMGSNATTAQAESPVEVLVLGTYHFDNPGLDLNNIKADDVLKPRRQEELNVLADALATFRPTKILVERVLRAPDLVDPHFSAFKTSDLAKVRDERVQIAYRLAHRLGHTTVYGIDEQPSNDEPDYFPFDKVATWAEANGRAAELEAIMAEAKSVAARMEAGQARQTIPEMLLDDNGPTAEAQSHALYYEMLKLGDTDTQVGADLNAMWYLRNAKIFAKLMKAASPGDRLLVVYGGGHNYWLRHFARTVPGYHNVDPVPVLAKAVERLK